VRRTARIRRLRRELGPHRETLFGFDRVAHVDVGYRYRDSRPTNELAIRLFVHGKKRPRRQSKAHDLAPPRFAGLPVDVICGRFVLHCRFPRDPTRSRTVRPLTGGIAISTAEDDPGTLGFVAQRSDGRLVGVTADHVVQSSVTVFQPPTGTPGSEAVGAVIDFDSSLRAALIELGSTECATGVLRGLQIGLIRSATDTEIEGLVAQRTIVAKSGERSGVTTGFVSGFDDGVVTISDVNQAPNPELACGGDSGAVWVSSTGVGVALHYGGLESGSSETTFAFGQGLRAIANRFDLAI